MILAHKTLAQEKCNQLLFQKLIEPTKFQRTCQTFYVNKRSKKKWYIEIYHQLPTTQLIPIRWQVFFTKYYCFVLVLTKFMSYNKQHSIVRL